jgi:uncharacterized RDD family membrane protein YckC
MQNLWGKRFAALIIDFLIVILITWVFSGIVYPLLAVTNTFGILNYWLIVTAVIVMVYFTYFEGKLGTTPGKSVMKIEVVVDDGEMNYQKAFIRNISKILGIPLILDIMVDYIAGSSKLRYLDEVAGTDVKLKA